MTKEQFSKLKRLKQYYNAGMGIGWLEKELGICKGQVKKILIKEGIYEPDRPFIRPQPAGAKHSITYWAGYFDVPVNSAYIAVRKKGYGKFKRGAIGEPKLLTEREFLASVVITRQGQQIISKMLEKGILLTAREIKHNIKEA
jgi:hypothetical protein